MNVAVLLSGGVDSSLALYRAKQAYSENVSAWYLKVWLEDDANFLIRCPWEDDIRVAEEVCKYLGIKLNIVPLQIEYHEKIISYVLQELREGRTPSPDIFCNKQIKFDAFYEAVAENFDKIVTGHYAEIQHNEGGRSRLYQSPDPVKDQTYFLSQLSQTQLARLEFPIGSLLKKDLRRLAEEIGLPNSGRPDSQGLCFLGNISYNRFIEHYLGERIGKIVDVSSKKVLGEHRGYWFHTIGQRTGLGLNAGPWYVARKDIEQNIVYVRHQANIEYARQFRVVRPHWIQGSAPNFTDNGFALKLRHGPKKIPCRIVDDADGLIVTMQEGDRGIAPGQFSVFYQGRECLGSAMIL